MNSAPLNIEDPVALEGYLRGRGHIGAGESVQVRVLAGGVSNRTVLVKRSGGSAWVLKQALAKLRVEADWRCSPARVQREALGLRRLAELLPPGAVPVFLFEDAEQHVLAMEAVPEPHANWKRLLLAGRLETSLCVASARLLAQIHAGASARAAVLEPEFADTSFFETLRLEPYYGFAAERLPEADTFLRQLIARTRSRRRTLAHGDFSPKNLLVHGGRLVLLDHEVTHWGDPAFDVGFFLTHLLSKAHHLPADRSRFAEAAHQWWETYGAQTAGQHWAVGLEAHAAQHTLGCLLARVAGRSPLEYLEPAARVRQQEIAVELTRACPSTLPALIARFMLCLSSAA
ncbi:MAG: hypothetical protein FJ387_17060 [Verrucomicrobia bacterium]|nr:hypothetical protein [Verrucomicrobiota bacterium]